VVGHYPATITALIVPASAKARAIFEEMP
jgi:hypothetical protein